MTAARRSVFARAARAYASRWDLQVLPLRPGGKEPYGRLVPHGYLEASSDRDVIANWWCRAPRANVGIACGPSGLLVVDVDPRNGGDETLARAVRTHGELPRTWTVLTPGGGAHYYFRCEYTLDLCPLGPGVDLKHEGYVVAPPSVHPNGGVYRWDVGAHPLDAPLAELPPAWRVRLTGAVRPRHPMPPSGIDARESFLGVAFDTLGWLGAPLSGGRRAARCPWYGLHSDRRGRGRDSSTVLFSPALGSTLGAFHCSHAHCIGRPLIDVLVELPPDAMTAAARAFPSAYQWVLRHLPQAPRAADGV